MRKLDESELETFQEKLDEYKERSDIGSSGWFGYHISDQMPVRAVFYSKEHNSEVEVFIRTLGKMDINFSETIIFPEPEGNGFMNLWPDKPLLIEDNEDLDEVFDKLSFGITNFYLVSSLDKFDWIINFCHERDVHVSGNRKFVNRFKERLEDDLEIDFD